VVRIDGGVTDEYARGNGVLIWSEECSSAFIKHDGWGQDLGSDCVLFCFILKQCERCK